MSEEVKFGLKKKFNSNSINKRPSIFNDNSDDDDDRLDSKQRNFYSAQKSQRLRDIEKIIKEDSTIYQYDDIYEEISSAHNEQTLKTSTKKKFNLSEKFEKSAYERNLRLNISKAKKNREELPEDDRGAFITESYKEQLKEQMKYEVEEKQREKKEMAVEMMDINSLGKLMFQKSLKDRSHIRPQRTEESDESEEECKEENIKPNEKSNTESDCLNNDEIDDTMKKVEEVKKREETPEFVREAVRAKKLRVKALEKYQKPDYSNLLKHRPRQTADAEIKAALIRYLTRRKKKLAVIEDDSD